MSTPPPLPPKTSSLAPSTRTMKSTTTDSSYMTELSPGRPTHAQRGTRTTASSIHLSHPDQLIGLGGDMRDGGLQVDPFDEDGHGQMGSAQDIANLPWAEPPPRDPSPLPPSLHRQPSFSFLTSDPAQQAAKDFDTISRRSSRSSIASRRTPAPASASGHHLLPSVDLSHDPHRLSDQTVHSYQSGMADMGTVEEIGIPPPRPGAVSQNGSPSHSHTSAMAVRASSSLSNRSEKSLKSAIQSKIRSLKSKNSSKSTTSSRKRISNSTIHRRSFQRKYGKWEVEMSPLLEKDDLSLRRREEALELAELLGRATVLERMLKAGQRISGPNPLVPSLRRFASKPTKTPSRPSTSDTTASPSVQSPSMRSFRRQFSRRIKRSDEFTDIDSQSGFGSTRPEIVVVTPQRPTQEKEKDWVVLVPETQGPPTPTKDKSDTRRIPTCMTFHPCSDEKPPLSPSIFTPVEEDEREPELFRQSPHLGHRDPDHHHRQSVMTYLSAGKWSSSTRGGRRRRKIVLGVSVGCVIGVILLTGLLAGLLARRTSA